jgi:hypothetical protein
MSQPTLFGGPASPVTNRAPVPQKLRVLITVKAAPNPSEKSGETVCVAGLALDDVGLQPNWVRLYPINFRLLEEGSQFKKYDIVELIAIPSRGDPRGESWKPDMSTLRVVDHLPHTSGWKRRKVLLQPMLELSMCALNEENRGGATGRSLALVTPRRVTGLRISAHPGWTPAEQAKIDVYVNQLDLFGDGDRTSLEAPRLIGRYLWNCWAHGCRGHEQSIIDWEFVALQRQRQCRDLGDEELGTVLRRKFLDMMCRQDRSPSFYVGNQAKRNHVFHVLGVYYPK